MANRIEFWLSYNNGAEKLRLPVNPESISVNSPFGYNDVAVSQLGELTVFGERGLAEFSFSSFFPLNYNPSYCEYSGFKERWLFVRTIERWRDLKRPIRLTVTGTRINHAVTIRDFEYEVERAGHPGDIYYSISFKEYRFFDIRVQKVVPDKATQKTEPKPKRQSTPAPAKSGKTTHTVVMGDTLQKISKKYYGTVNKWRTIYNANKKVIGINSNEIRAGQKLVIP